MFESIRGQTIAVRMLKHEIERHTLPQTMLFHGPASSGKFLTAVELVRSVLCENSGPQGCSCAYCRRTETLASSHLFVISRASLRDNFELWKKYGVNGRNAGVFERDLRRLRVGIEGDDKYKKQRELIDDVLRDTSVLAEGREKAREVIETALSVTGGDRTRVIGIDTVREIQRFLSLKSGDGRAKFVIVDGAERMNEESSNSFLKISEETPAGGFIVLITEKRGLLKETIRSRCREYRFTGHTNEVKKKIVEDVYGTGGRPAEVRDGPSRVDEYVDKVVNAGGDLRTVRLLAGELANLGLGVLFLDRILTIIRENARLTELGAEELQSIERLYRKIDGARTGIMQVNMNVETVLADFVLNYMSFFLHYIRGPLPDGGGAHPDSGPGSTGA